MAWDHLLTNKTGRNPSSIRTITSSLFLALYRFRNADIKVFPAIKKIQKSESLKKLKNTTTFDSVIKKKPLFLSQESQPLAVNPLSVKRFSVNPLSVNPLSVNPSSGNPLSVNPQSVNLFKVNPLSVKRFSSIFFASTFPSQVELTVRKTFFFRNIETLIVRSPSCWRCETPREEKKKTFFFCQNCGAIQPVDQTVNFFTLLGINPSFHINISELEKSYKTLQKELHPDKFATKSEEEREYSAEQSSHVIGGYYTLLRPLSRARYLLKLEGREVGEESTLQDQGLLIEVMEIREAIEEAESVEDLKRLYEENERRFKFCEKKIEDVFETKNLDEAVRQIQRLSYFSKIREELNKKI